MATSKKKAAKKPAKKPSRLSRPKRKPKPLPKSFKKPIDVEYVALSEIVRWPRNPKDHDEAEIKLSFERFGYVAPIQRDEATGELVAGHGRVDTLSKMIAENEVAPERIFVNTDGEWWVPVLTGVAFVNIAEAHAYAVADNRTSEIGGWKRELAVVLQELKAKTDLGLQGLGYTDADLSALLKDMESELPEPPGDPDAVPEPPKKPVSRTGDLWLLGEHRVLCGDSTKAEDVKRLMGGELASMVCTDPPYGMDYHGEVFGKGGISNDGDEFAAVIEAAAGIFVEHSEDAVWAVCFGASRLDKFFGAMRGLKFHRMLTIYKPNRMAKPWRGWIMTSEFIALFSVGNPKWNSQDHCHDVYTFDYSERPDRTVDHPTVKPLSIIADVIAKASGKEQTVADPFLGSGTTLIACEKLNRRCYGMEIDPGYTDVICRRYEEYAGREAVLDGTGKTFAQIKLARSRKTKRRKKSRK